MIPNFKVTITHCGESTDYIDTVFSNINVKRRENNYDTATLTCEDKGQYYYTFKIAKFDDIKIYFKNSNQTSYTQVFGGTIRQVNPTLSNKYSLVLNCKGYGAALEETHCNRDYGIESANPAYDEAWLILADSLSNFVNKSFTGAATGYAITGNFISGFCGTQIKYINTPYKTNLELADIICTLTSAIEAGSAGGHYIIDPSKRFLFAKIGDHAAGGNSPELYWPDWWNILSAESVLTEGIDFTEYTVLDKTEEYANHIVLLTDFRRPSYDYWTESNAASWGNYNGLTITDDAAIKIVGANSLKVATDANGNGEAYWPSGDDAHWDVTKWGSIKTIPRLNFYLYHAADADLAGVLIKMNTARGADYFYTTINATSDPATTWVHHSIPIGDYWASADEAKQYKWAVGLGTPVWTDIHSVGFYVIGSGIPPAATELYIDDLHFSGKIARSAKDTSEITRVNEYQKVLIARNSMNDSCVGKNAVNATGTGAGYDDGYAARTAYAELLRRTKLPLTISFTLKDGKPQMMQGQKATVQLCKRSDATYAVNTTMRLLTVEHNLSAGTGLQTSVTATTDLTNSFPMSVPDQYAMWLENMFVNSSEAKNIRAGAEVDLLIPMLESTY